MTVWGFSKIQGYLCESPNDRVLVFWGLFWSSPSFGKPPYCGVSATVDIRLLKGPLMVDAGVPLVGQE